LRIPREWEKRGGSKNVAMRHQHNPRLKIPRIKRAARFCRLERRSTQGRGETGDFKNALDEKKALGTKRRSRILHY